MRKVFLIVNTILLMLVYDLCSLTGYRYTFLRSFQVRNLSKTEQPEEFVKGATTDRGSSSDSSPLSNYFSWHLINLYYLT